MRYDKSETGFGALIDDIKYKHAYYTLVHNIIMYIIIIAHSLVEHGNQFGCIMGSLSEDEAVKIVFVGAGARYFIDHLRGRPPPLDTPVVLSRNKTRV